MEYSIIRMEHSRVEWSGVEWSGVEWSGRCGIKRTL